MSNQKVRKIFYVIRDQRLGQSDAYELVSLVGGIQIHPTIMAHDLRFLWSNKTETSFALSTDDHIFLAV